MNRLPQRSSLVAQITAILREEILAGKWNKWLPGEHDLCSQFQVARMTLRAALAELQREGMVRSRQGKRREIVTHRGRNTPTAKGPALLLVREPMEFLERFTVFWITELRKYLNEAGYQLEIHSSQAPYGQGMTTSLKMLMRQYRPAAWIISHSTHNMQRWFAQRRLPCVIVGSRHPGVELPSVDRAHRAACRHAVGQFLARGHMRLVLLNPDSGAAGDFESELGFNEAVALAKRPEIQASIVRHNGTVENICHKVDALLRRPNAPTALLVSRSGHVLTVIGHLMRMGVRLPRDMALISRDNDSFLANMVPSVARYAVSPEAMARSLFRTVLAMAQGEMNKPTDSQIMPEFTEGETLGPKRAGSSLSHESGGAV